MWSFLWLHEEAKLVYLCLHLDQKYNSGSWFCLLSILQICLFLFTSGSASIVSCLSSSGGFKPVCLAVVISPHQAMLHAPTWDSSLACKSPWPPWPLQGSFRVWTFLPCWSHCYSVAALPNSFVPSVLQAIWASFLLWVLFVFLFPPFALFLRP